MTIKSILATGLLITGVSFGAAAFEPTFDHHGDKDKKEYSAEEKAAYKAKKKAAWEAKVAECKAMEGDAQGKCMAELEAHKAKMKAKQAKHKEMHKDAKHKEMHKEKMAMKKEKMAEKKDN